ncbi:DNA-binding response regulator [Lachnospiraceae bacterium]|uniref:response regulator transcription factor n=1 Tax=Extibacter sp. GGCC_0201 TaxID=2731209 RepID=UPI001AA0D4DD|nr:response regulator transcription factor [Extibacter sp. GGCC_0201]MBO1719552.1 response regulator transcription factor [Extibacter sp. GGCC_0201]BDF32732.1 DNA-binding response regulator [Lachnospiraceae bacterium]BDF36737.1 DNA-binding response regulator [Lachnospiraceae bacterium]
MGYKILIADDEPGIIQLLKDYFEIQGYEVIEARNGVEVMEKLSRRPDIILLDVSMPGIDGFEVCRRIRAHVSCPILFLTAKVEEQDRINGLRLGGDDYIMKPFAIEELGARVEAHLRREERKRVNGSVLLADRLAVHYSERSVYYDSIPISFTKMEFDIVEIMSMNPGQVFSKDQLYEKTRGYDGTGDSSIVTEHIRRIRSKLAEYTEQPYIETVWGVGYKWIG